MDDNVFAEIAAVKRKLQSKTEALAILNRELATCKRERDHFKEWYESKRNASPSKTAHDHDSTVYCCNELSINHNDKRDYFAEIEELKKKLKAANDVSKELRGKCGRERGVTWHQREELIEEIEEMREKMRALSADLQSVLDEKEEIIIARDAYRFKVHRLNHEMQALLKSKTAIDIDALIMENKLSMKLGIEMFEPFDQRSIDGFLDSFGFTTVEISSYLKERFEQSVAEKEMLQQGLTKYKTMLDKNRIKGNVRLGTNTTCGGMVVTHRQVQELLENDNSIWKSPYNAEATLADLRSLSLALLEALQDKSLALTHQRKANKILAQRVTTLESRMAEEAPVFPSQLLIQGLSNSSNVDKEMDKSIVEEYKEYIAKNKPEDPKTSTKLEEIEASSSNQKCGSDEEGLPPELQELVLRAMEELNEDPGAVKS